MSDQFKPGDKLWFESRVRYLSSEIITVKAVGRVWVTLSNNQRFRKNSPNMFTDDQTGRCYLSKDHRDAAAALSILWSFVHSRIRNMYSRPEFLSADAIRQIADALHIEVPADV